MTVGSERRMSSGIFLVVDDDMAASADVIIVTLSAGYGEATGGCFCHRHRLQKNL